MNLISKFRPQASPAPSKPREQKLSVNGSPNYHAPQDDKSRNSPLKSAIQVTFNKFFGSSASTNDSRPGNYAFSQPAQSHLASDYKSKLRAHRKESRAKDTKKAVTVSPQDNFAYLQSKYSQDVGVYDYYQTPNAIRGDMSVASEPMLPNYKQGFTEYEAARTPIWSGVQYDRRSYSTDVTPPSRQVPSRPLPRRPVPASVPTPVGGGYWDRSQGSMVSQEGLYAATSVSYRASTAESSIYESPGARKYHSHTNIYQSPSVLSQRSSIGQPYPVPKPGEFAFNRSASYQGINNPPEFPSTGLSKSDSTSSKQSLRVPLGLQHQFSQPPPQPLYNSRIDPGAPPNGVRPPARYSSSPALVQSEPFYPQHDAALHSFERAANLLRETSDSSRPRPSSWVAKPDRTPFASTPVSESIPNFTVATQKHSARVIKNKTRNSVPLFRGESDEEDEGNDNVFIESPNKNGMRHRKSDVGEGPSRPYTEISLPMKQPHIMPEAQTDHFSSLAAELVRRNSSDRTFQKLKKKLEKASTSNAIPYTLENANDASTSTEDAVCTAEVQMPTEDSEPVPDIPRRQETSKRADRNLTLDSVLDETDMSLDTSYDTTRHKMDHLLNKLEPKTEAYLKQSAATPVNSFPKSIRKRAGMSPDRSGNTAFDGSDSSSAEMQRLHAVRRRAARASPLIQRPVTPPSQRPSRRTRSVEKPRNRPPPPVDDFETHLTDEEIVYV